MGHDITYDIKSAKNMSILQLSVRCKITKWRLTKRNTGYDCKSSENRGEKYLNLIPRKITSKIPDFKQELGEKCGFVSRRQNN